LTGKTCAENKPTLGCKDAYEVASKMTKDEAQQKLIAMLRKDAYEGATLVAHFVEENKKLRAFAREVMEAWPEGGIEGDDMQEIAVKHGMLAPEIRHEPCGEWCNCNAGVDVDGGEWERGVECYRRTALLTGESE
jgi:hypothetical protein